MFCICLGRGPGFRPKDVFGAWPTPQHALVAATVPPYKAPVGMFWFPAEVSAVEHFLRQVEASSNN